MKQLMTRKEIEQVTGLKRSTLYSKVKKGIFPPQIKIGIRAVAWRAKDVDRWLKDPMGWAMLDSGGSK